MPKPYCNHALHIILSIVTGGLWLFIYIPILIEHGSKMKRYRARYGR